MEYLGLLYHRYQWEWIYVTKALDDYIHVVETFITDYRPCYYITQLRDIPLYGCLMLLKVLILAHGVMNILPKWVSLTLFPTLLVYYHVYLSTSEVVMCKFDLWNYATLWTLVWQFPYREATPTNMMWYSSSAVFFLGLEVVYKYLGCQFAIDVFIVLSTLWFLVKSFSRISFNVSFVIAACAILYFQQGRGPQVPEVFYIFLFLIVMGVYAAYTLDQGTNDEMLFFISTVIGITLLLMYNVMMYGFTGMESSKAGQEFPFQRLPVYYLDREVPENILKDDPGYSEEFKPWELNMKETDEEIGAPRPIYIDVFPLPTPKHKEPVSKVEIESIILTQNDDGSTNFSAVKYVKYRNNETLPTMLY